MIGIALPIKWRFDFTSTRFHKAKLEFLVFSTLVDAQGRHKGTNIDNKQRG